MIDPVGHKVAEALELKPVVGLHLGERAFDEAADHLLAEWVERGQKIPAAGIGLRFGEKALVEAQLRRQRIVHA